MVSANIQQVNFFSNVVKYVRPMYGNKEEPAPLKQKPFLALKSEIADAKKKKTFFLMIKPSPFFSKIETLKNFFFFFFENQELTARKRDPHFLST